MKDNSPRQMFAALPLLLIALLATVMTTASTTPRTHPLPWTGCDSLDVAVDGNVIHLLIGTNMKNADGIATCDFRHVRSDDGGNMWSAPVLVSADSRQAVPHHRGSDARIIARGNQLFAAWTTPGTGFKGTGPMGTAISADGGKTWQSGPDPSDQKSTGSSRFLALAADAQAFHLIWLDDRNKQRGLRHASSADGGKTWSINSTIDEYTCACCWNTLLHVPAQTPQKQGQLYALYRDMKPSDMGLARSADSGRTWEKLGHLGAFEWIFDGCPHVGGGLAAVQSPGKSPQLFAAVWTGKPENVGCHLLASEDDGSSWIPVRRLGQDTARHPVLAARGVAICIAWDDLAGEDRAAFAVTSNDGGATWSKARRLSAADTQGSHARVIANPKGEGFIAFWTQSTGNESPVLQHRIIE